MIDDYNPDRRARNSAPFKGCPIFIFIEQDFLLVDFRNGFGFKKLSSSVTLIKVVHNLLSLPMHVQYFFELLLC